MAEPRERVARRVVKGLSMLNKVLAALAFVAMSLAATAAAAFDSAPHAQITEQAMAMAGYNRAAADAVQVENWLTDYYTSAPTFPSDQQCMLEKLHFDDIFNDKDVEAYWKTLLRNTLAAAVKAKADNDPVEFYTVLGVSLHAVQDFYSHSNWVETDTFTGPGFDTTTYLQWFEKSWLRRGTVQTGWYDNCLHIPQGNHPMHGGYTSGMNHDSVVRPRYNRAYVFAVAASYEWLKQIQQAVDAAPGDPAFLSRVMVYGPSPADAKALAADQDASLYISEWISNPLKLSTLDGHWNGNRSGYIAAFTKFSAGWIGSPDSIYVQSFKHSGVYGSLSRGLYQPFVGTTPPISPAFVGGTVIDMRVGHVCANYRAGNESYFGVAVPAGAPGAGYPIRDAALHYLPCTDTPWEYLVLAPSGRSNEVSLNYSLWNEYGLPTPGATAAPISGSATRLGFFCSTQPSAGCRWNVDGGAQQPMPASLNVSGSGFKGVALSGISIQTPTAAPWRP